MDRGLQGSLQVLSFAVAAIALAPQREDEGYREAISSAVQLYNQEPGLAFAFRLLEAKTQLEWDSQKRDPQNLEFAVKETVCPSSEQVNPEECDFKEDGVVKKCSGMFLRQEAVYTLRLNCEAAAEEKSQGGRIRRDLMEYIIRKLRNQYIRAHRQDKSSAERREARNKWVDHLGAPPRGRGGAASFIG